MSLPWWVSWLTACGTMLGAYLLRRLYWQGYVVGLANQVLWWWITVATSQWGFVVINVFMTYNYIVGMIEWRRVGISEWRRAQHAVAVARRAAKRG